MTFFVLGLSRMKSLCNNLNTELNNLKQFHKKQEINNQTILRRPPMSDLKSHETTVAYIFRYLQRHTAVLQFIALWL